jgi:hypothetical protein
MFAAPIGATGNGAGPLQIHRASHVIGHFGPSINVTS